MDLTSDEIEMMQRVEETVPVSPEQLIAERHDRAVEVAARQVNDSEKARRRKRNKQSKLSRRRNRH